MAAVPATLLTAIVTLAAIVLYIIMSIRVGQMRGKHNVTAPATTGAPEFERAYRVQMNTLEQMPIFLPALWLATIYFRRFGMVPPVLGAIWVIGRVLYMSGYMADPSKRGLGFGVSAISQLLLLILAAVGIVMAWGTT
ncbi:MAG TPA: MAPEG family protein [Rhizomicrobium sp.]|jgi:glutathione S-transferase|nr:MAPEG family protein [Rhizomicrobium sp.]